MMVIVKVKCLCGNWVRIRTKEKQNTKRCWNCGREVTVKYSGKAWGYCDGVSRPVDVEYEQR